MEEKYYGIGMYYWQEIISCFLQIDVTLKIIHIGHFV